MNDFDEKLAKYLEEEEKSLKVMSAREMFEELGYNGDISWRSALYSKFNKDNNGETKIDIDLEIPQHTIITKKISSDFWGEEKMESFTVEEIKAVNKLIDELIEMYKIEELLELETKEVEE